MVVSLEGKVFVRTAEFTLMIALLQITGRGVKKNLNQVTIGLDQPHYLLNDKKYKRRCDLLWSRFCQLSIASRDIIIYKECTNALSPYYSYCAWNVKTISFIFCLTALIKKNWNLVTAKDYLYNDSLVKPLARDWTKLLTDFQTVKLMCSVRTIKEQHLLIFRRR